MNFLSSAGFGWQSARQRWINNRMNSIVPACSFKNLASGVAAK
jgi:hypothetical protein